ncbi:DUF4202 family protein [Granulosicoccaceae sp. 1_MG-2023]|nr:DUF4202 family protein [Granulosicoccaceae sp. 1_MG-2023]
MDKALQAAMNEIRRYIAGSSTPEDPAHADNTLHWLLKLKPDAGPALQLAALGHDIDRASPDKVQRRDFSDYDAFKAAHARHGAAILAELLCCHGLPDALVQQCCDLVRQHETGGTAEADVLRDADSLSYFDTNLPLYLQREGEQEALRRSLWGLQRLSPGALALLGSWQHKDPAAAAIIEEALVRHRRQANGTEESANTTQ